MIARVDVTDDRMFKYVIDLDTGKRIAKCIAANDILGTYACHATDPDGRVLLNFDKTAVRVISKRGKIRIMDRRCDGEGGSNLWQI